MKLTALIVDDEPDIRRTLKRLLKLHSVDAIEAENGQTGLELFEKDSPHFIITDVRMPKMDGIELLKTVRKRNKQIPVIVMSAYEEIKTILATIHYGATNYFQKPSDLDVLESVILPVVKMLKQQQLNLFDKKNLVDLSGRIHLKNNINLIQGTVNYLLENLPYPFLSKSSPLQMALIEMIINAIEHGNLAISSEEKMDALENETLDALIKERAQDQRYQNRKVDIRFEYTSTQLIYTITDEGDGFDWKKRSETLSEDDVLLAQGRGIFLAKLVCDKMEYNDKGNQLRMYIGRD